MHGNGGVLVGVGRLDLGGQREFVLQRLARGEQLPGEDGDGGFRHAPARHDMVREADGLDLFLGPARRAAEGSGRNFGSLIGGMVLRNRFGGIDREEFRRAAVARGSGDRVGHDLAVDRTGGGIGVRLLVRIASAASLARNWTMSTFRIDAVAAGSP